MPYELCRHIMTTGKRCQSPALEHQHWCYFHNRLHLRSRSIREAKPILPGTPLRIPSLEDPASIQIGISLVVQALATGHIDEKRASMILRGLQCAARNAVCLRRPPHPAEIVRDYLPTLEDHSLAERRMNDNSEPPPRPPRPPIPSRTTRKSPKEPTDAVS